MLTVSFYFCYQVVAQPESFLMIFSVIIFGRLISPDGTDFVVANFSVFLASNSLIKYDYYITISSSKLCDSTLL